MEIVILKAMGHRIGTLAPAVIATIPGETMQEVLLNRPRIALAFWWNTLQDEGLRRAAEYQGSYLHLDRATDEPESAVGRRLNGLI